MKHTIIALVALLILSCSNDDDSSPVPEDNNSNSVQTTIQNTVTNGKWIVTKFEEEGKDETQNFAGYLFTFQSDGVLLADSSQLSYQGAWSITDDNSSDDTKDDLHFNILFNLTNDFEDLNDDWDILSQAESKLELIDISGGNGGTDYLTFEKQ